MRRSSLVLTATSLAAFTATLDNTVVAVALRDVQRDLGTGVTGLQGVVTAYTVALAALLLAGGALVDVVGARRVLLAGLGGFALTSVLCATAPNDELLVAWRGLQGAAAALLLPGALAVLAATYPEPERRRRAVGTWAGLSALALVAGPVLGGWLVEAFGWESVFWVNVPLCLLVAGLLAGSPEVRPGHGRRLDPAGTVLVTLGLASATYAVVLAGRHGLTWPTATTAVAAVLAFSLLRAAEDAAPDPLVPRGLLRDRAAGGALLAGFAASFAVFVLLVFLSLYLTLVQDRSAQETGNLLLALPVAVVLTAPLAGRWRAVHAPVVLGLVLTGVACLALGLVVTDSTSGGVLVAWLAVAGVGIGLTSVPVVAAVLAAAGPGRGGIGAGAVSVARELGGVLAVGGLGAVAVARLADRLQGTLSEVGLSGGTREDALDALLGARTDEVRSLLRAALEDERASRALEQLTQAATDSFVASTQLVLVTTAVVVLVAAVVSALLLRRAPAPP